MKFKGKNIEGGNEKIVPILRTDENIIFVVKSIRSYASFEALCPRPEPPKVTLPGGRIRSNVEDKNYSKALDLYASMRTAWIFLESTKESPNIEWESVNKEVPETWVNWQTELTTSGFTEDEIGRILTAVLEVNGLSESMVEAARQSFLATRAAPQSKSDSRPEGQTNSESGEPANGQASDSQILAMSGTSTI